jgi:Uma2 family endonuclease
MVAPSPKRVATVEELLARSDAGEAVELVEGQIVDKALPTPAHGSAQAKTSACLDPYNRKPGGPRGPGGWWIMTEVEVLYPQDGDVYRHDVVGFRRDRHPSRPEGLPVELRPDWVCEILSPSTARRDVVRKQRTLHAHGVPHYWLLDPERETLTVLRHQEAGYTVVASAGSGESVRAEPFAEVELELDELLGLA